MRSASRDVLLRAALLATASAFYCSPLSFLSSVNASAGDAASRVVEIRLWLTLLATVAALVGVISTQLVLASCLHAAVHVAQAVWHVPLCTGSPLSCWHVHGLATCVYEYGSILSFVLVLRYVLMPLPSTLATTRRHSRQLKRFFQQHDPKYVSLVDRLLDDYTGNERLLFARIRKIYRAKTLSAPQ